jgi:hypothetical protein
MSSPLSPAIHDDIVGNGYDQKVSPIGVGGHLVLLAGAILPTSGSQNYWRNYIGEVLTWGDKQRIVFRSGQLRRAIYGYVAADLAGFDGGGGGRARPRPSNGNRRRALAPAG